jgi:hypothetical protein
MAALMMLIGLIALFVMPKEVEDPAVDMPEIKLVWY